MIGRSEIISGGRLKTAILGDAMEAVIAAIYLDGGLESARISILKVWGERLKDAPNKSFEAKSGVGLFCQNQALSNGLIVRAIGDNIGFCPPLIISEKELDQLFDIFTKSLKETQNWISNSVSI